MNKTIKSMVTVAVAFGMTMAASAKTWTNFTGFGLTLPTDTFVDVKDGDKASNIKFSNINTTKQWGFSGMYMGVHENGFAVRGVLDFYSCKMSNEMSGFDYDTIGMDMMVGAGYAPIHDEHFTLGVFGMIGITGSYGKSEEKKILATDYVGYVDTKSEHTYAAMDLGVNVTAAYTLTNTFSFWGSITAAYVCPGMYNWKSTYGSSKEDLKYDTTSTYRVIPAVGVCWRF